MVTLRPYQTKILSDIYGAWADGHQNVCAVLPTGAGKCLGKDTPVLMFDGTIKKVQDIKIGDVLIGPDSKPRNVLSTCHGKEPLYRVLPTKGDSYIVNESHILSLKQTGLKSKPVFNCQKGKGEVTNICVKNWLKSTNNFKHTHKGWRTGIEWGNKINDPYLPPYMLGLWLGDGLSKGSSITTMDKEIEEYIVGFCLKNDFPLRIESNGENNKSKNYHITSNKKHYFSMKFSLKTHGLIKNKHIPLLYKTASREDRLNLLAGIIDTDGSLTHNNFDITQKSMILANDIAFVARSLGFAAYVSECKKTCTNTMVEGTYYRVSITGPCDNIPVRIKHKKAGERKQKKSVLVTGIKVEPIGVGEYYGFEIDGDRLFLLGDFTVTHNTVAFGTILAQEPGIRFAIAHRQELVSQMSMTLAKLGIEHCLLATDNLIKYIIRMQIDAFGKRFHDPRAKCFVTGVQTLINRAGRLPIDKAALWVLDECFPPGTLVDGKPIEQYDIGDTVLSFDEKTKRIERQKVTHVFKNMKPKNMVRIDICGHHVLQCTFGHPFYTKRGWVKAIELTKKDEVLNVSLHKLWETNHRCKRTPKILAQKNRKNILRKKMWVGLSIKTWEEKRIRNRNINMLGMWKSNDCFWSKALLLQENGQSVLLKNMLKSVLFSHIVRNNDQNEQKICVRTDEKKQSYAQRWAKKKNACYVKKNTPFSKNKRGEWKSSDRSRVKTHRYFWRHWFPISMCCKNRPLQGWFRDSSALQNRLWEPFIKNRHRNGRNESLFFKKKRTRLEKRYVSNWLRVEDVSIYESRSSSEHVGNNSNDYVYNLEIENTNTYLVNGFVVHNCHHSLRSNIWGKALSLFPGTCRGLGVTATPNRADGRGIGRHSDGLFDAMVEGPNMRYLINEGYLTDYRIFGPYTNIDLSSVAISASTGDYSKPKLVAAVRKSRIVGDVVKAYQQFASGKIGVVFVPDVQTGEDMAESFNASGIPAKCVHAGTPDADRQNATAALKRGDLKILTNVDIFGEGYDLPAIECVIFARPTESYPLYCLDPETEILTENGWCNVDQISNGDNLPGFNIDNKKIVENKVIKVIKRNQYENEKIVSFSGPHLDFKVTENHNMLYKVNKNILKRTAFDLSKLKSLFYVPVSADGDYRGSGLLKCELLFLGWFLSDGYLNKKTNAIQISQSVTKIDHLFSIRQTLIDCGFKYGVYLSKRKNTPETHKDLLVFSISKGKPRRTKKHLKGWSELEPWINKDIPEIYDKLTRKELKFLLETLNLGDGNNNHQSLYHNKKTLTIDCGVNEKMADRLQAICITRGFRCNKKTVCYENKKEWYYLHIRDCETSSISGCNDKDGVIFDKKRNRKTKYKRTRVNTSNERLDYVWCVSTTNGNIITRRNGKVIFMGNCQQFGRGLRVMSGKEKAIIIDHVHNIERHGKLPDSPQTWSLDSRERKASAKDPDLIPIRTCRECLSVYESWQKDCPYCGWKYAPLPMGTIEQVEGVITELDPSVLAAMRGEINRIDGPPPYVPCSAQQAINAQWKRRQDAQQGLREAMSVWAGYQRTAGQNDDVIMRRFYKTFGTDVITAQTFGRRDAEELTLKLMESLE